MQTQSAKFLAITAALAIANVVAAALPAAACSPPPPPNWGGWIGNQQVSMALGRVERVEVAEPRPESGEIIVSATAHIVVLETIQGPVIDEPVQQAGVLEVRRQPGLVSSPGCWIFLQHEVGDLVIVVKSPFDSRVQAYGSGWASLAYFAPFFDRHQ